VDASFLVAWYNERDAHHKAAAAAMQRLSKGNWGAALLPEYVVLETLAVLAAGRDLSFASAKAKDLVEAPEFELVPCSPLFAQTLDLFRTQAATRLSFADCAIVAIARDRAASHVATFDEDFESVPGLSVVP
jgi:predicted nucleic acid-binding protein